MDLVPQFSTTITWVKVAVNNVKVIFILDTGSTVNIISSRLAQKIIIATDLDFFGGVWNRWSGQ